MAKICNPIHFSEHFEIDPNLLFELGVLDPILNADTPLFIDPLLIKNSRHREIKERGYKLYEDFFCTIIKLLKVSSKQGDKPWRSVEDLMHFPEIKGTCLGYGSQSISGSGSGPHIKNALIKTAKEIIDLGISDPDLFIAMGLFEEGFGPDRISDMTTGIILPALLEFNERITNALKIARQPYSFTLKDGNEIQINCPINPFEKGITPIILVPNDILRELPIVKDWSDIARASSLNNNLRKKVNTHIGNIWHGDTKKNKAFLKQRILSSKLAFDTCLELIHQPNIAQSYNFEENSLTLTQMLRFASSIVKEYPYHIHPSEGIEKIVKRIIEQFRFLIEKRRLSIELYHNGKPRKEKSAQNLFFAIAHAYCRANNLDITPEAETGNGPVDFKISKGFDKRIVIEIKLSSNPKLVSGYTRQLQTYKQAEQTEKGYYLVLDVGKMGNKDKELIKLKDAFSDIIFIDAKPRPSASKL